VVRALQLISTPKDCGLWGEWSVVVSEVVGGIAGSFGAEVGGCDVIQKRQVGAEANGRYTEPDVISRNTG